MTNAFGVRSQWSQSQWLGLGTAGVRVTISMTVLSAKVNYQSFCKSLPSEMGDACIATQKIKGSFVKDHS